MKIVKMQQRNQTIQTWMLKREIAMALEGEPQDLLMYVNFLVLVVLVESQKLKRRENKCMFGLIIDCFNDDSYFCFTE